MLSSSSFFSGWRFFTFLVRFGHILIRRRLGRLCPRAFRLFRHPRRQCLVRPLCRRSACRRIDKLFSYSLIMINSITMSLIPLRIIAIAPNPPVDTFNTFQQKR